MGVEEVKDMRCENCMYFRSEPHETELGEWGGKCDKLKISRNPWSRACNKLEEEEGESRVVAG
ncbi:hypothetical protein ES703_114456 [subsurface metagenome]